MHMYMYVVRQCVVCCVVWCPIVMSQTHLSRVCNQGDSLMTRLSPGVRGQHIKVQMHHSVTYMYRYDINQRR